MKSFFRGALVFLLIWTVCRGAIYFLPGDPAEFLVHESLVQVDPEALRIKMDLDRPLLQRILSLPRNRSLVRDVETLPLLKRAWTRTTVLAFISLLISIPLTFALLFFNFTRGKRRFAAEISGLLLASIPILVLGPELLRWVALPNPLLPALVLSLHLTGFWYRTLSRRMDKLLPLSSVNGARALGFGELTIFWRSLLAPSLGGFILFFSSQLGVLLNGSILVETLFQWDGVGTLLADAVLSRDYPVLELGMMSSALVTLMVQQAGYALQSWWDPRIA